MTSKGLFICLEGLDGSGKTTQAKLLVERLRKGHKAIYTSEPGHGEIGRLVEHTCLHAQKRCSYIVEALLFAADRFEHIEKVISPAINEGKIVISDRYLYSSLAYQGAVGQDLEWIRVINKYAIRPDLALFIDVDPETVVKRLKPRRSLMEDLATQKSVREFYVKLVQTGELVRVDGNRQIAQVAQDVLDFTKNLISKLST